MTETPGLTLDYVLNQRGMNLGSRRYSLCLPFSATVRHFSHEFSCMYESGLTEQDNHFVSLHDSLAVVNDTYIGLLLS
jgi:hypothetical protein